MRKDRTGKVLSLRISRRVARMCNSAELAERSEDNSSAPRGGKPSRRFRCRYQPFSDMGKGAAFSQRLAVSVQNPGGRSPEGFSCPAGPLRVSRQRNSAELAERSEDNSSAPRSRKVRFAPPPNPKLQLGLAARLDFLFFRTGTGLFQPCHCGFRGCRAEGGAGGLAKKYYLRPLPRAAGTIKLRAERRGPCEDPRKLF